MWDALELFFTLFFDLLGDLLIYKVIRAYPLRCLLAFVAFLTVFWFLYC